MASPCIPVSPVEEDGGLTPMEETALNAVVDFEEALGTERFETIMNMIPSEEECAVWLTHNAQEGPWDEDELARMEQQLALDPALHRRRHRAARRRRLVALHHVAQHRPISCQKKLNEICWQQPGS